MVPRYPRGGGWFQDPRGHQDPRILKPLVENGAVSAYNLHSPTHFKSPPGCFYYLIQRECHVTSCLDQTNSSFASWNFLEFAFRSEVGWLCRCRSPGNRGPAAWMRARPSRKRGGRQLTHPGTASRQAPGRRVSPSLQPQRILRRREASPTRRGADTPSRAHRRTHTLWEN